MAADRVRERGDAEEVDRRRLDPERGGLVGQPVGQDLDARLVAGGADLPDGLGK
jgi:hypothetical protein